MDSKNIVHISYVDHDNLQLNYAKMENGIWTNPEKVVSSTDERLGYASIKVDSSDIPHIFYIGDGTTADRVVHTSKSGSAWSSESVYTGSSNVRDLSFVLDSSNTPPCQFRRLW